jgi:hypothetical protein
MAERGRPNMGYAPGTKHFIVGSSLSALQESSSTGLSPKLQVRLPLLPLPCSSVAHLLVMRTTQAPCRRVQMAHDGSWVDKRLRGGSCVRDSDDVVRSPLCIGQKSDPGIELLGVDARHG